MKTFIHSFKSIQSINLLRSGEQYFNRLIELIEKAHYSIHLQVYIFDTDTTGNEIAAALIRAAKRGVSVYVVLDAYASNRFSESKLIELKQVGIHIKLFAPYAIKNFKIGRRLHHKIVMIDEQIALIGGINIAQKYRGSLYQNPWLDLAVEVNGRICFDIKELCLSIWSNKLKRRWPKQNIPHYFDQISGEGKARLTQNDWWRKRIEISGSYRNAIRHSKEELTIVASYFLPGYRIRKLLIKAANRGVKITFVFGTINDIPLMNAAIKYLYLILLKNNISIYEWNKSVLHAKFATADGIWSTIGSYNLNSLSDYGSLEANIEIMDQSFAKKIHVLIDEIIAEGGKKIDSENYISKNNMIVQSYRWLCYQLIRVSLFILFVLMKRDRLKSF